MEGCAWAGVEFRRCVEALGVAAARCAESESTLLRLKPSLGSEEEEGGGEWAGGE